MQPNRRKLFLYNDFCDSSQKNTIGFALISRRSFVKLSALLVSGASTFLASCSTLLWKGTSRPFAPLNCPSVAGNKFDYVIIGSGAGGGPLACNLALKGFRVLLLEAGGEDDPCEYYVPAFHARASEHEALRWDFFVRHYADDEQQRQDDKFVPEQNGVLYPRSGTLGGCTAHNAMLLIYPHNSDWDYIAEKTGDESWRSENMHKYFKRMERCEYASRAEEPNSKHGFEGWLPTNLAEREMLLRDKVLRKLSKAALEESLSSIVNPIKRTLLKIKTHGDPNDWRFIRRKPEGLCKIPITTGQGRRAGAREYILRVREQCPNFLEVRTHALAKRILLDEQNKAYGVEYISGAHQYRADPQHGAAAPGIVETVLAEREVIVSAGAFNTPQLLKLSGIGPREELECHGIAVKVDLPGVGENLQDRYELGVVTRLRENIPLIKGMKLRCPAPGEAPDSQFSQWLQGVGPYTTNGATIALMKRSFPERPDPDLFIFGLIGDFRGYYPGYANNIARTENAFTWAILKGHTANTAGRVTLRSADPRDVPDINFHYFSEGTNAGEDMESLVAGVETVRNIIRLSSDVIEEEVLPGPEVKSREDIRRFIENQAWGHHASCTCKMGAATDPMAVVDSRFRVYGTRNLRIVDASVFPKIPGFFIASSVYMISEKACDVISEDAERCEFDNGFISSASP
ncbi:choline dehydrogenase [Nitrosospira multiformis]|uniref:Choline dehydrogenase n=1 Tax=Nitrosospira multiformis TaxID=1231 RepID=A0A1H8CZ97_9PROT|nr:choline dehydrogenase [Nitrosospira multiformis]